MGKMRPDSDIPVSVIRDLRERFAMTVTVGKEDNPRSEEMSLPPAPTMKIVEEPRYSGITAYTCTQCNIPSPRSNTLSIPLGPEVLVPKSEYVFLSVDGSSTGLGPGEGYMYSKMSDDEYSKTKYHPHSAEVPTHSDALPSDKTTSFCANYMLRVNALAAIPINSEFSGRNQQPPSLVCKSR
jgi:hypothetical protein